MGKKVLKILLSEVIVIILYRVVGRYGEKELPTGCGIWAKGQAQGF